MPNAVYSLLLLLVVFVLGSAFFKSELFGYACIGGLIFAFMVVLHHYLALQMIGYAAESANPYLRYFFFRSAVTVGGAAPLMLLAAAWLVRDKGFEIANVDTTVILERPKLKDFRLEIRELLAKTMGLNVNQVSVKFKTAEKVGPVGEGKSAEAQAVVLLSDTQHQLA